MSSSKVGGQCSREILARIGFWQGMKEQLVRTRIVRSNSSVSRWEMPIAVGVAAAEEEIIAGAAVEDEAPANRVADIKMRRGHEVTIEKCSAWEQYSNRNGHMMITWSDPKDRRSMGCVHAAAAEQA